MKPTLKALAQATAIHLESDYDTLVSRSRTRAATEPRHTFFYIANHEVGHTLSHIGRWSDRDHSAVRSGVMKMKGKVSNYTVHRIVEEAKELDAIMRQRVRDEINRNWGKAYDPKR